MTEVNNRYLRWIGEGSLLVATAFLPYSTAFCHAALALFCITWLLQGSWSFKFSKLKDDRRILSLLILAVVTIVSALCSDNRAMANFVLEKKIFFFILPLVVISSSFLKPNFQKKLQSAFCISVGTGLIYCFIHALWLDNADRVFYFSTSEYWHGGDNSRWLSMSYVALADGLRMHPTYLSMYAAFCVIILCSSYKHKSTLTREILLIAIIIFFCISIIFLSSRIVIVALTGIIVFFILRAPRAQQAYVPALVLILLIAGVFVNPVTRYRQVEEILANGISVSSHTNYTNSTAIRSSLWWLSWKAFSSGNWAIGTGMGDVEETLRTIGHEQGITNVLDSYNTHSEYIFILLSSGFVGLIAFSYYLFTLIYSGWHSGDSEFIAFMFLIMVVAITENVFELQKGIVFFSIFSATMMRQHSVIHFKMSMNIAKQ